jgi:hypothetical protein
VTVRIYKPYTWAWRLLAGFISGGSGALTVGPLAALFAPTELNLKAGLWNLLTFMSAVFILAGAHGALMYLAKSPVPELIENGTGDTSFITKETSATLHSTTHITKDPSPPAP